MATMKTFAGENMYDALSKAVEMADDIGEEVTFRFNKDEVTVYPGQDFDTQRERVEEQVGYEILTRQEMAERARENLERSQREADEAMEKAGVPDEEALREAKVPWPESMEELTEYIDSLVDRPHDYGTCVYAMSMSALATYYYVSKQLGVTGFQASCADMDFLKRSRHMELGFRIVDFASIMYPQYWEGATAGLFAEILRDNEEVAKAVREKAQEHLKNSTGADTVRKHWQTLADGNIPSH